MKMIKSEVRGWRIKQVRLELELTVGQMAEIMQVSPQHQRNVESGRRNATIEYYSRMEIQFGVSLDYLINGKERPHINQVTLISNDSSR